MSTPESTRFRVPRRADDPVIRVADVVALHLATPNLDRAVRYYRDFGLHVVTRTDTAVYLRGVGTAHHCLVLERDNRSRQTRLVFRASQRGDLDLLAERMETTVQASDEPGGGERVTLADPSGLRIDVIHGQQTHTPMPHRAPYALNGPADKPRVNRPQRAEIGPALIFRLGHAVMQRQEFLRNARWYIDTLGLIPSDIALCPKQREPLLTFLRCDRGADPADHHTVVIAAGIEDALEHAAFETLDIDSLGQGGEYLKRQGWHRLWGIGRHVLGSQLFDYHTDPDGMVVEHFTDGDVLDADYPTNFHVLGQAGLYHWGQDIPDAFIDTRPTWSRIKALWSGLRRREQMRAERLGRLKWAMEQPARPWMK